MAGMAMTILTFGSYHVFVLLLTAVHKKHAIVNPRSKLKHS